MFRWNRKDLPLFKKSGSSAGVRENVSFVFINHHSTNNWRESLQINTQYLLTQILRLLRYNNWFAELPKVLKYAVYVELHLYLLIYFSNECCNAFIASPPQFWLARCPISLHHFLVIPDQESLYLSKPVLYNFWVYESLVRMNVLLTNNTHTECETSAGHVGFYYRWVKRERKAKKSLLILLCECERSIYAAKQN